MAQLDATAQNEKIGQKLAKQPDAPIPIVPENEPRRTYPKTHVNYWKARLEHRMYTRDGKTYEVPEWSVRIHFGGVRKSFDLETGNKEEAAAKARDIYLSLIAKGWSATLADLKPKATQPIEIVVGDATIGEFLAEVERTSSLKPKTFRRLLPMPAKSGSPHLRSQNGRVAV